MEELQATNFQYVDPRDEKEVKQIFISSANSFHGKEIVNRIQQINSDENEKTTFEIFATFQENHMELLNVQKLMSNADDFPLLVSHCDIIVCDISQGKNELEETKNIIKFIEENLENGNEVNVTLILISSIMTWARTPKNLNELTTDRHYRRRRPHPCFNQHLIIERRVLNLHQKYKNLVKSFVVCPGIIYGEEEDIFHYIFRSCYLNNPQVDIFLPASNKLPIIYIHDFARFTMEIITKTPDGANYFLAVQTEPLSVKEVVTGFIEVMGGEEMRLRICEKEEIFLMNEEMMTQRVYDHLTLDLQIQSELLSNFSFEITGLNFQENVPKIIKEYFEARNLRPIKILVDGSPYAYQNDFAKILSNYYHIHHVKNKCFMKNFITRLKKKIDDAVDYQKKMGAIESAGKLDEQVDCPMMMLKAQNNIDAWSEKIKEIQSILAENEEVVFDEKKQFLKERLESHACIKNQGYVTNGFELDREKSSFLFLDESGDFNELKPDVVIILNRTMDIDPECLEIEGYDENDKRKSKQWKLKCYYDTQYDDLGLFNFFNDHNVTPIEISVDHDLDQFELMQIFESIKFKIGEPCFYALSDAEKKEIEKIKNEIAEREKLQRDAEGAIRIEEQNKIKERQIGEWIEESIEQKKRELEEFEKQSLPVRHYLMKHVMPKISASLVELARIRPSNPAQFLAYHLSQQQQIDINDKDLDQDVLKEFNRLSNVSKCDV